MNAEKPYGAWVSGHVDTDRTARQMVESEGTERPRNRRVCTSGRGLTNAYEERRL